MEPWWGQKGWTELVWDYWLEAEVAVTWSCNWNQHGHAFMMSLSPGCPGKG